MRSAPDKNDSYVDRLLWGKPRPAPIVAPPGVTIAGEVDADPSYLRIVFADGLGATIPKTAVDLLPRLVEIHDDVRRQAESLDIHLTPTPHGLAS